MKSKLLVLTLGSLLGLPLHGADTNPPVIVTASSYDGQTVGVFFSEVLDAASATNIANYRIADAADRFRLSETNFAVTGAALRPDARSVVLTLANRFPGGVFVLSASNVLDLAGNSAPTGFFTSVGNLAGADVGLPGVDPEEPGSFFCCGPGGFEVLAGGSGLEGTNDGFHFIYEPWRFSGIFVGVRVTSLEAANRLSSAGLMVREDVTPGSRFFSVLVTPPGVPARDGSGNGANAVQVRYRDSPNGPSTELITTNSVVGLFYPDVWLELFRIDQRFVARYSTNHLDWVTVGDFTFATLFPDQAFIGMATSSHNNTVGFTTKAVYSDYWKPHADIFPGPQLLAERSASNLLLKWPDEPGYSFFLMRSLVLDPNGYWEPVTNQVTFNGFQAMVTLPMTEAAQFFVLRRSPL